MKSGDLSLRVPIEGTDEMANLASAITICHPYSAFD
jgi:uncharacterized membrane protein